MTSLALLILVAQSVTLGCLTAYVVAKIFDLFETNKEQ